MIYKLKVMYFQEAFFVVTTIAIFVIYYFVKSYQYWARKGVPFLEPRLPLGNATTIFPKGFSVGIITQKFYTELKKRGHKFGGVYLATQPCLMVTDPDYIKDILIKDFYYFVDRGFYHNIQNDPLSAHLFSVDGATWRNLRMKLTPTFSSGKMKMMFHLVTDCSNYMKEYVDNVDDILELKDVSIRYTTDVIGSCAFGVNCNSFNHRDADFCELGKKIFDFSLWRGMKAFFVLYFPNIARKFRFNTLAADEAVFLKTMILETVKKRQLENIHREDFLQLLIDLKSKLILSDDEIVSNIHLFFVAGFETSSTAMTFALYEMAKDQAIQSKAREEIELVLAKHRGQLTYDSLKDMKFLDQVIQESLRMYPPLTTLTRRCCVDYTLRDTNVVIEKGTSILMSTLGLHMDPEYFPNPKIFDPDRFTEEYQSNIRPCTYLPFGDGPRNCIGIRFGMMQSKIGIITLIKNYELSVSSLSAPVTLDPDSFLLKNVNKIYLNVKKL